MLKNLSKNRLFAIFSQKFKLKTVNSAILEYISKSITYKLKFEIFKIILITSNTDIFHCTLKKTVKEEKMVVIIYFFN